jgi:transcriptional regulator with XRE-family HTH domain
MRPQRAEVEDRILRRMGQRIKGLRMDAELSQLELAEKMDFSRPLIAAWENGTCAPKFIAVKRLAKLFKVRPGWLIYGEDA